MPGRFRADSAGMSDVQQQWETAIGRGDLIGAFGLLLNIQTDLSAADVHRCLVSLCPHVEPGAIPALSKQLHMLGAALGYTALDDCCIVPFEPHGRSFEIDRRLPEVPDTLEQALGGYYETAQSDGGVTNHSMEHLADFDRLVAAFTRDNPQGGREWYLRLIAAPGGLLPKVTQIPQWMAAVHTSRELTHIAKLVSQTIHLTEPVAS